MARMRARLLEIVVPHDSYIATRVVAAAVNHLMRGQALAARLGDLSGKRIRLQLTEPSVALTFEIGADGVQPASLDPHVTMSGALADFVALALRREDPDTLFFQRRLVVEGETETGLHLKNLLDGCDYDLEGHLRATLPAPLARLTMRVAKLAHGLRGLSRLRRPGSHRNSRPADKARGAWR